MARLDLPRSTSEYLVVREQSPIDNPKFSKYRQVVTNRGGGSKTHLERISARGAHAC